MHKGGVCTSDDRECTRRNNVAEPHGNTLGITVYSTSDMTNGDSEEFEYIFTSE